MSAAGAQFSLAGFRLRLAGFTLYALVRRGLRDLARRIAGRAVETIDNRIAWQVLAHLCSVRRIAFVTSGHYREEGACSQVLLILVARIFARGIGAAYAHTSFTVIHQSEGDAQDYAHRWETCFNLGAGAPLAASAPGRIIDLHTVLNSDLNSPRFHRYLFGLLPSAAPDLRARYARGKRPPAATAPFTVTIHIRRGADVTADRNAHLWTGSGEVSRLVREVVTVLDRLSIAHRLELVSRGAPQDFVELAELGCSLHLDEHAREAFDRLAAADLLVLAKGRFSYVAGMAAKGLVLCPADSPLPPLADWLAWRDGGFDAQALEARLARV